MRSSTAAAGFPRMGRRASCCRKLPHQLLKGLPPTQLLTTRPMMSMAGQHEPQPWCTKLVELWSPSLAPGTLAALAELRDPHAAPTPDVMGFSKFPMLPIGQGAAAAVRRCPVLFAAWRTSCPNAHVHVISDVLCRLVGRNLAQVFAPPLAACDWGLKLQCAYSVPPPSMTRRQRSSLSMRSVPSAMFPARQCALLRHPKLQTRQLYGSPAPTRRSTCSKVGGTTSSRVKRVARRPLHAGTACPRPAACLFDVREPLGDDKAAFSFLDDTCVVKPPEGPRTLRSLPYHSGGLRVELYCDHTRGSGGDCPHPRDHL